MGRVTEHDAVQELLAAYALDAVEPDEAIEIEEHLDTCPRCRDELRAHREVVGLLAYRGQEAPAGLWDRVVEGIAELESGPVAADGERRAGLRRILSSGRGQTGPVGLPGRVVALAAAAAIVVVALLGVEVVRLQQRTDHLSHQVSAMSGQPTMAAVDAALEVRGATRVDLIAVGGRAALDAVILPSGEGLLYDPKLGPLPSTETYQLWGEVGSDLISYGLIGSAPASVTAFRAGSGVSALAVTVEVAGGVVRTTHSPVAAGPVD